ncbi:helix-turn-helix transcriptional regulator [bacterium]|nr:helix-turn-helix transcriptional regulator [bacterium]
MSKAFPIQNRLRSYRRSFGLKQRQVALAINLASPTQISRWERGERLPNLVQALRLSALYKRLVNDLFFDLFQEQREIVIARTKVSE